MSDLADRLVGYGAVAIQVAYGPATERKARQAICAALRVLDAEAIRRVTVGEEPIDLIELAAEIERGA